MDLTTVWFVLIAFLWTGYFVLEGFEFGVGALLPLLALCIGRAIGLPHKVSQASVSAAAGGGLLLLIIGAVSPVLVLLALVQWPDMRPCNEEWVTRMHKTHLLINNRIHPPWTSRRHLVNLVRMEITGLKSSMRMFGMRTRGVMMEVKVEATTGSKALSFVQNHKSIDVRYQRLRWR